MTHGGARARAQHTGPGAPVGVAALLGAGRRAEGRGGDVTLLDVPPSLLRLLRITGVAPLFAFGSSCAEERGEPA